MMQPKIVFHLTHLTQTIHFFSFLGFDFKLKFYGSIVITQRKSSVTRKKKNNLNIFRSMKLF